MRQGDTQQELVGIGVMKRYRLDSARYGVGVFTVAAHQESWYWEDLTGEALDMSGVGTARKLEIDHFKQMGVYEKVPAEDAKGGCHKVLGARWVGVKKADDTHRSRLMAKGIKTYNTPELFAAPPPIEALKCILMRAADDPEQQLIHTDVSQAYFYADAARDLYVPLPREDQKDNERHLCSQVVKVM